MALILSSPAAPAAWPGENVWQRAIRTYASGNHAAAASLVRLGELGHPTAIYEMGYLYEHGDGVPQDMAEAARWYARGAAMGEPAAEAASGHYYEYGTQVTEDWFEAAKWYVKSAQQNQRKGLYMLGRAYEFGIGVPVDREQAIAWYEKAAAQWDSDSGGDTVAGAGSPKLEVATENAR